MGVDRRNFIKISAGAAAVGAAAGCGANVSGTADGSEGPFAHLQPMTDGIVPISDDERRGRMDKARRLMVENGMDAIYLARVQPLLLHRRTLEQQREDVRHGPAGQR